MELTINQKEIILPESYVSIKEDEMYYHEGGHPIVGAIVGYATVLGLSYGGGRAAGERAYYAGYSNATYQKHKWKVRSAVLSAGLVGGPLGQGLAGAFLLGFENKFYEMVSWCKDTRIIDFILQSASIVSYSHFNKKSHNNH